LLYVLGLLPAIVTEIAITASTTIVAIATGIAIKEVAAEPTMAIATTSTTRTEAQQQVVVRGFARWQRWRREWRIQQQLPRQLRGLTVAPALQLHQQPRAERRRRIGGRSERRTPQLRQVGGGSLRKRTGQSHAHSTQRQCICPKLWLYFQLFEHFSELRISGGSRRSSTAFPTAAAAGTAGAIPGRQGNHSATDHRTLDTTLAASAAWTYPKRKERRRLPTREGYFEQANAREIPGAER